MRFIEVQEISSVYITEIEKIKNGLYRVHFSINGYISYYRNVSSKNDAEPVRKNLVGEWIGTNYEIIYSESFRNYVCFKRIRTTVDIHAFAQSLEKAKALYVDKVIDGLKSVEML